MGEQHIFCYNCIHFDEINMCKTRAQFVNPQKGRYCQDFVDKTKIPQPVKPLEEVPVAPVKTQLELTPEIKQSGIIKKKVSLITTILRWLLKLLIRR